MKLGSGEIRRQCYVVQCRCGAKGRGVKLSQCSSQIRRRPIVQQKHMKNVTISLFSIHVHFVSPEKDCMISGILSCGEECTAL